MCAGTHGTAHGLGMVGKAEHHDRSVSRVGAKSTHAISEAFDFSVGVEQGDVDPSSRSLPDVELDDMDLPVAGLEQGAEAFEDDLVVVDESDLDRFFHTSILGRAMRTSNHPTG